MIQDSNPNFQINPDPYPDPDVCRICPKMLRVSRFAKYGTNRPLIVREMLTNVQKNPLFHNGEEMKKSSGIHTWIWITNKSYHFWRVRSPLAHAYQVWSVSVSVFISYPVYRMTERMTERSHNLRLVGGSSEYIFYT